MTPVGGSVLGVDIGFSPVRRSGAVCRLDWDRTSVHVEIDRFRALEPERSATLHRVAARMIFVAAFDGPLRGDLAEIGRYRAAERMLTRKLQPLIGKPGSSSAPVGRLLNAQTNLCADILLRGGRIAKALHVHAIHPHAIVEAFPNAFLGVLIEEPGNVVTSRSRRSDDFYLHLAGCGALDRLLAYLLPGRLPQKTFAAVRDHDERAALVCALTALCVAGDDYTVVGDHDGMVVLPPRYFIQPWAWALLAENAKTGGKLDWQPRDLLSKAI